MTFWPQKTIFSNFVWEFYLSVWYTIACIKQWSPYVMSEDLERYFRRSQQVVRLCKCSVANYSVLALCHECLPPSYRCNSEQTEKKPDRKAVASEAADARDQARARWDGDIRAALDRGPEAAKCGGKWAYGGNAGVVSHREGTGTRRYSSMAGAGGGKSQHKVAGDGDPS